MTALKDEYERTMSEIRRLGDQRAAHMAETRRLQAEIIDLATSALGVVPVSHLMEAARMSRQTFYSALKERA